MHLLIFELLRNMAWARGGVAGVGPPPRDNRTG